MADSIPVPAGIARRVRRLNIRVYLEEQDKFQVLNNVLVPITRKDEEIMFTRLTQIDGADHVHNHVNDPSTHPSNSNCISKYHGTVEVDEAVRALSSVDDCVSALMNMSISDSLHISHAFGKAYWLHTCGSTTSNHGDDSVSSNLGTHHFGYVIRATILQRIPRKDQIKINGHKVEWMVKRGTHYECAVKEISMALVNKRIKSRRRLSDSNEVWGRKKISEDPLKEVSIMQIMAQVRTKYQDDFRYDHCTHQLEILQDEQELNIYSIMPEYSHFLDSIPREYLYLTKCSSRFPEFLVKPWIKDILYGLECLHRVIGVCHRDISPDNIMYNQNGCVIIDYGISLRVPHAEKIEDSSQTPLRYPTLMKAPYPAAGKLQYMAPELLQQFYSEDKSKYYAVDGFALDMWSIGILTYSLLLGDELPLPRFSCEHPNYTNRILTNLFQLGPDNLSSSAMDFIRRLLQVVPSKRFSASEALKHEFLEKDTLRSVVPMLPPEQIYSENTQPWR